MITELTKEQEAQLSVYRDKWTKIGLDTSRANRARAEQACRDAYKVAGLEEPKIILWAESPMGLLLTAKLCKEIGKRGTEPYKDSASVRASVWASVWDSVGASVGDSVRDSVGASVWDSVWNSVWNSVRASVWDSVGDSVRDSVRASVGDSVWDSVRDSVRASVWDSVGDSVWDSVGDSVWDSVRDSVLRAEWNEVGSWGQHDANWLGFYDFFREVCGLTEQTKKLVPLSVLSEETGWHLFYKGFAVLSERPTVLHRNTQGKLHCETGPAIEWADGYKLFRLNGVDVSEEIALMKPDEVTAELVFSQSKQNVKNEIIKKLSFDEWLKRGYVPADGILEKLMSQKTLGEVAVFETDKGYVAKRGSTFSHGQTVEQAIADLRYKISDRDTSRFKSWKLEDEKSVDEIIEAYRVITGACEYGTKQFVEGLKDVPQSMKLKVAVRLTKGQFGNEQFEEFFG